MCYPAVSGGVATIGLIPPGGEEWELFAGSVTGTGAHGVSPGRAARTPRPRGTSHDLARLGHPAGWTRQPVVRLGSLPRSPAQRRPTLVCLIALSAAALRRAELRDNGRIVTAIAQRSHLRD